MQIVGANPGHRERPLGLFGTGGETGGRHANGSVCRGPLERTSTRLERARPENAERTGAR
jgi:hypothetical protein